MDRASLRVLRNRRDIACVLVNPLQALHPNAGAPGDSTLIDSARSAHFDRAAYAAWLRELRAACSARGIVLIFDEVFVGFRLAPGGAQEYSTCAPTWSPTARPWPEAPRRRAVRPGGVHAPVSRRSAGRYLFCMAAHQCASDIVPPGKTDIGRPIVAKPAHELRPAAQHADGSPPATGLAVGDMSARTSSIPARRRCKPETDEDFVENQHDAARAARRAQFPEPGRIRRAVEVRAARTVDERQSPGAPASDAMLQRIDQHAGDIAAVAQHPQARPVHVLQGVGFPAANGLPTPG